jgi:putative addiction module component (TIGR02574 family)
MTKVEILEELPKLTAEDRQEIRQKLNEIDGDEWLDGDDPLTDGEKALLEVRLAAYEREPDRGSSWEEVEARIQSRIKG